MKSSIWLVVCAGALGTAAPASAGVLDRIKQKADEVARSTREVTHDVKTVTNADERAAGAARSAAVSVEAKLDVESHVRAGVADTDLGRAAGEARSAQGEIKGAASTDERVEREVKGRVQSTAADLERRADVQTQAENAVRGSDGGAAAADAKRKVDATGRIVQDPAGAAKGRAESETDGAKRALEDAGGAVRELGSTLH